MYREYIHKVEHLLREITGENDVLLTDGGDHADIASTVAFALLRLLPRLLSIRMLLVLTSRQKAHTSISSLEGIM